MLSAIFPLRMHMILNSREEMGAHEYLPSADIAEPGTRRPFLERIAARKIQRNPWSIQGIWGEVAMITAVAKD
jgi:hypothetical protein